MDRATVPSSYDVRRCVRWFEARSSAIQRACHHKFGRSSPFSGSLSRWTFCNGNRIQLPRYRFSTSPQALHTLPVWLGQRQTSKTAPGAQINGHTIHLPPILAKKPDVGASENIEPMVGQTAIFQRTIEQKAPIPLHCWAHRHILNTPKHALTRKWTRVLYMRSSEIPVSRTGPEQGPKVSRAIPPSTSRVEPHHL